MYDNTSYEKSKNQAFVREGFRNVQRYCRSTYLKNEHCERRGCGKHLWEGRENELDWEIALRQMTERGWDGQVANTSLNHRWQREAEMDR